MATNDLLEIKEYGQSIWMGNLSRDIMQSGEFENLVKNQGISGIISNPTILEKAITGNAIYDADIEAGILEGLLTDTIYKSLVFADISNDKACADHSDVSDRKARPKNRLERNRHEYRNGRTTP